jgi:hypothetical protein
VLCDFAENYFFTLQDEPQGFHWHIAQPNYTPLQFVSENLM